jgi:hypothetical protein
MAIEHAWVKEFSYNKMRQLMKYLLTENQLTQVLDIDATAQDIQTTGTNPAVINGVSIPVLAADAAYDVSAELPYAPWAAGNSYTAGGILSEVSNRDGTHFVCILANTSAVADEPGYGANWRTYWKQLDAWAVQAVGNSIPQDTQGHYLVCALADGTLRAFIAYNTAAPAATVTLRIPPYDPERYVVVGYVSVVPTSGAHVFGTTVLTTVGTFTQIIGHCFPDPSLLDHN